MIEKLKHELRSIEEALSYMEATDTTWHPHYTKLIKKSKILKKTIKKLNKLEELNR